MVPNPTMTSREPAESLFIRVIAPRAPLYALVDAARESRGPHEAAQAGVEYRSLFVGELGERLTSVAPHVVAFHRDASFYRWWFEQWGRSIGVLVEAPVKLPDLWRHFRTLLMVRGQHQQRYYFRFYDPRVLRVFLPECTPEELQQFFGPITTFYCESDGGAELLSFALTPKDLSVKHSPVTTLSNRAERNVR